MQDSTSFWVCTHVKLRFWLWNYVVESWRRGSCEGRVNTLIVKVNFCLCFHVACCNFISKIAAYFFAWSTIIKSTWVDVWHFSEWDCLIWLRGYLRSKLFLSASHRLLRQDFRLIRIVILNVCLNLRFLILGRSYSKNLVSFAIFVSNSKGKLGFLIWFTFFKQKYCLVLILVLKLSCMGCVSSSCVDLVLA